MPTNTQSEQYYHRSHKTERAGSLPFGAGSLWAQGHDTLHMTEHLALCDAIVKWHYYIHSVRNSMVYTAHMFLTHILTPSPSTAQLMEYQATLQNYTYDIQYIAGVKNLVADVLTTRPDFRHMYFQVSQYQLTLLVVSDWAEWL
jgi:hypothetical protein